MIPREVDTNKTIERSLKNGINNIKDKGQQETKEVHKTKYKGKRGLRPTNKHLHKTKIITKLRQNKQICLIGMDKI